MGSGDMLGSGASYVSRGVLRARPRRVEKRLGALGLVLVLASAGLADVSHRVVSGDNLTRVARRYRVSVSQIASANRISNLNLIRTGQLLRIPASTPGTRKTSNSTQPAGALRYHKVARGENLTGIATRYGTSVARLVAVNGIRNPALVRAGQSLQVPGTSALRVAGEVSRPAPRAAPPAIPVVAKSVSVPVQPPTIPPKPPTTTISSRPAGVEDLIELYSRKFGVQPALMKGLAWQESGWKQHVVSSAGAIGVMQVLPQTGEFVSRHLLKKPVNLNIREQNIEAGIAFYAFYLSKTSGDERTAVAGYFQGLRSVWQNGISEATKKYVEAVFALGNRFAA